MRVLFNNNVIPVSVSDAGDTPRPEQADEVYPRASG